MKRRGGATVLDVPALAVAEGQFCGLAGPNGSGKTTLIEILAGLEAPTAGEVRFRGRRLPPAPAAARWLAGHVASVLQPARLFRGTVRHNVEYGLRARGVGRAERRRRAAEALDRVGLGAKARRDSRALSRGEAQRVALARALVLEAEVLLLDEPLTAIDHAHQGIVLDALRGLKDAGRTVVMAAHDMDSLLALADELMLLDEGRAHQQPLVNVLMGTVEMGNGLATFRSRGGLCFQVLAHRPGPARVVADPAAIVLSAQPLDSSARNCCTGTVRRLQPRGAVTVVEVDAGETLVAHITEATRREMGLKPGARVCATIKTSALKVL
ncbi:MAG: ATP-binding cassette domain-containing protein [Candidatus Brocadiia bacterium]